MERMIVLTVNLIFDPPNVVRHKSVSFLGTKCCVTE